MSKSLGNVIVLDDIIQNWFDPLVFKYFIYTAHYRSIQDFSWEDLRATEKAYNKLKTRLQKLSENINLKELTFQDVQNIYEKKLSWYELIEYLLDDIDTVKTIAWINKYVWNFDKLSNEDKENILSLIKYIDDKIFKLDLFKEQKKVEIPEDIKQLAKQRWQAKQDKNWNLSDKLRDELLNKWYNILDKKDGYEILTNK